MDQRTCTIDGCSKPLEARGICAMHRSRLRKRGTLDAPPPRSSRRGGSSLEERFWSRVTKAEGCWPWDGVIADNGYGHLWYSGRNRSAHRLAWEFANGPIPAGLVIDHICHVRHCVNPDHLRLATVSQNRQNHGGGTDYPTASGVRGVWRAKNRWVAVVTVDHVVRYREYFNTLEEAADAVRAARLRLHTFNDLDRVSA